MGENPPLDKIGSAHSCSRSTSINTRPETDLTAKISVGRTSIRTARVPCCGLRCGARLTIRVVALRGLPVPAVVAMAGLIVFTDLVIVFATPVIVFATHVIVFVALVIVFAAPVIFFAAFVIVFAAPVIVFAGHVNAPRVLLRDTGHRKTSVV